MRLQSRVTKQVDDKKYYTHSINIPSKIVDELGWGDGVELTATVTGGVLVIAKT